MKLMQFSPFPSTCSRVYQYLGVSNLAYIVFFKFYTGFKFIYLIYTYGLQGDFAGISRVCAFFYHVPKIICLVWNV